MDGAPIAPAISEARVATALARRYMIQLCKHFEHRLPVRYGAAEGEIAFGAGICRLAAQTYHLLLRAEAKDAASLPQLEHVVAKHLLRFAFREPPEIKWERVGAQTQG